MNSIKDYQKWSCSVLPVDPTKEGNFVTASLIGSVGDLYSDMALYHSGGMKHEDFMIRLPENISRISMFLNKFAAYYDLDMTEALQEYIDNFSKE